MHLGDARLMPPILNTTQVGFLVALHDDNSGKTTQERTTSNLLCLEDLLALICVLAGKLCGAESKRPDGHTQNEITTVEEKLKRKQH